MIETVENFINKYSIKNRNIVIGFSGGPDSCALALIMKELQEKYNLNIRLAYFNHGWREEAIEEEKFTKDFALKHNFSFTIKKAEKNIHQTEETARELRYSFLKECAKDFESETVFLAHNKNDNIETLVYRIIKGTSIKGLCAIPENRDIYYRPLLKITKEEILSYLNEKHQTFKIDISNNNTKYKRNLIRKEILPIFSSINPNYINNIEILIQNSIRSMSIIDERINEIENNLITDKIINREKYINCTQAERYELLNKYLGDKLKYRNYKNIKKLDDFILANKHSKTSLNKDLFLRTRKNKIFIEENKK